MDSVRAVGKELEGEQRPELRDPVRSGLQQLLIGDLLGLTGKHKSPSGQGGGQIDLVIVNLLVEAGSTGNDDREPSGIERIEDRSHPCVCDNDIRLAHGRGQLLGRQPWLGFDGEIGHIREAGLPYRLDTSWEDRQEMLDQAPEWLPPRSQRHDGTLDGCRRGGERRHLEPLEHRTAKVPASGGPFRVLGIAPDTRETGQQRTGH